jgi:hypothetical protein
LGLSPISKERDAHLSSAVPLRAVQLLAGKLRCSVAVVAAVGDDDQTRRMRNHVKYNNRLQSEQLVEQKTPHHSKSTPPAAVLAARPNRPLRRRWHAIAG